MKYPYEYRLYIVLKRLDILGGPIAPWFGQPGLGVQFFTGPTEGNVESLVRWFGRIISGGLIAHRRRQRLVRKGGVVEMRRIRGKWEVDYRVCERGEAGFVTSRKVRFELFYCMGSGTLSKGGV